MTPKPEETIEGLGPQDPSVVDSLERSILIKLSIASRQMVQRFDQSAEAVGITRAKFGVIAVVARHPGSTQRSIAEALSVTEVTAGRLIERLCADGYLERRAKSNDRRAHCVFVTAAARPLLEQLGVLATEQEAGVFAGMDRTAIVSLGELLDTVLANLATARPRGG